MSDHERAQERVLRQLEDGKVDGRLDEASETWTFRDREHLDRHNAATRLTDDTGALTPFAIEVLEFEQTWWKYQGAKETRIRTRWDVSPTRYYQLLNTLIDLDPAAERDALTVGRLRRLRDARRAARTPDPESEHLP